ncbi:MULTISPECIES: PHB depolymerase family esterase [unclassified Parafrankia]|uniref:alpha/beta hydrolase family esterase n=1 Tax=unclassified Parafrankia TaxID=2994368 RepID=UPI000DA43B2B|nr:MULTISPECIES: PHB depolymerase family esterase [unclassified Parafrankia]TCJ35459.1 plasmid partitioning protein [Parafrankia sp. BMG5.11]SQD99515.1 putative LpqP (Hydrolase/esterase) [Parafrankia sp. Ea1.12]
MSAARSRRFVAVRLLMSLLTALLVVAGCGLAGGAGPSARPGPTSDEGTIPTPPPTIGPDAFEQSGRGGQIRLTLPDTGTPGPYPLVVALHSLYHDGTEPQHGWGLDALARSAGFAVVYPDGLGMSWNAGTCCGPAAAASSDDVGWLRSLIAHLESRYPIDPRRVSIIGLSNGGMLAYRYACEHGDELAGFAVVAASLQTFNCTPPAPVTMVSVHGGMDGHVPYAGALWSEALQTGITPVEVSLAPFRAVDGCPSPTQPADTTTTGADGRPIGATGAQVGAVDPAGSGTAGPADPAIIAAAGPGLLPATTPPAAGQAPLGQAPLGQAPLGQPPATGPGAPATQPPAPPVQAPPVAVRHETTCSTSARLVQYVLPALGHGWPPLTGAGSFDTAAVLWELLGPARSATAGPRI